VLDVLVAPPPDVIHVGHAVREPCVRALRRRQILECLDDPTLVVLALLGRFIREEDEPAGGVAEYHVLKFRLRLQLHDVPEAARQEQQRRERTQRRHVGRVAALS